MSYNPGRILLCSILLSLVAGLASADTDAAKVFHGAINVESYNQVMLIAVDANNDGNADNIFAVATYESFNAPLSYRWKNADLVFKASGIMVTSPAEREALIVTFKRNLPKANFIAPAEYHTSHVADAIGLAHHYSLSLTYPMDGIPSGRRSNSRITTNTYDDGWYREPYTQDWDSWGSGGGCLSGGSGSTSCSISGCASTSYKNDCSVTCMNGYYACCNCGNCTCLRYDGRNG
jgi:hypothetical protein